jgi:hypothetical protein
MLRWLSQYRENYARLRRIADAIEAEYQSLPYKALLNGDYPESGDRDIDGLKVAWSASSWKKRRNDDVTVEVLFSRLLPTFFGVRPCIFFHKRPDGSVYH